MKQLKLIFCLTLLIASCKKDNNQPIINYVSSDSEVKYKITLSHDTILEILQYLNDQLKWTTQYLFNDTTGQILTKNASGIVVYKTVFVIGVSGYAETSVDSSFDESGAFTNISTSTYEYQNGFLINKTIDSGDHVLTYSINNDNIVSSSVSHYSSTCTDYYSYTSSVPNLIDIRNFSNKIFGKASKNLITHASWRNNCPCGPSSNPGSSRFVYEFNSNGYITKSTNYYIPCYHSSSNTVTGSIGIIHYEY